MKPTLWWTVGTIALAALSVIEMAPMIATALAVGYALHIIFAIARIW